MRGKERNKTKNKYQKTPFEETQGVFCLVKLYNLPNEKDWHFARGDRGALCGVARAGRGSYSISGGKFSGEIQADGYPGGPRRPVAFGRRASVPGGFGASGRPRLEQRPPLIFADFGERKSATYSRVSRSQVFQVAGDAQGAFAEVEYEFDQAFGLSGSSRLFRPQQSKRSPCQIFAAVARAALWGKYFRSGENRS